MRPIGIEPVTFLYQGERWHVSRINCSVTERFDTTRNGPRLLAYRCTWSTTLENVDLFSVRYITCWSSGTLLKY